MEMLGLFLAFIGLFLLFSVIFAAFVLVLIWKIFKVVFNAIRGH